MLRALIVSTLFASQAYAVESYTLSCKTQANLSDKQFQALITLKAEAWLMDNEDPKQEQVRLRDVVFTAQSNFDKANNPVETGRVRTIDAGINPKAKKYKDYYSVSMDSLIDAKDFSAYAPLDQCSFMVFLPTNMWNKNVFDAALNAHCDQNGGVQGLNCTLTPKKK